MKLHLVLFTLLLSIQSLAQLTVTEIGFLPEPVSNNAQCEGFVNGVPYIYSFCGIDTTKTYQGIHLKSFRYNTVTNTASQLADLPDSQGKIAAAANRIGDTIYITGGYHVFQNGSEVSSKKLHRFNTITNSFMADGPNLPQATDDHVQVVWRDSLLILITGWKNTGNITHVQIYNPSLDSWEYGTPVPNNHTYKSFGASGTIIGDTIYYFGGAQSSGGFNIQNAVRKGIINPSDPSQIDWSFTIIDPAIDGYRMAATNVGETMHWLGGSTVTYNYDGIAYNGSGGVPPSNRDLYTNSELSVWQAEFVPELPMDLRGIANLNDSVKYIVGGMTANQSVTDKVYKLEWNMAFLDVVANKVEASFKLYPNPINDQLNISISGNYEVSTVQIFDMSGRLVVEEVLDSKNNIINTSKLNSGIYLVVLKDGSQVSTEKVVKLR